MSPSETSPSRAEGDGAALGADDALSLLGKLATLSGELVLVGGQALNFWVQYFRPVELAGQFFTSKDIDFFGEGVSAARVSQALGGTVRYPTPDDHPTPNTALVSYVDSMGEEREIDFLGAIAGVNTAEIARTAVPIPLLDQTTVVRVLHPFLCLRSRTANIVELQRSDSHSRNQLAAAILCMRELLVELLADDVRAFHKMAERLYEYARADNNAISVFHSLALDVFALPSDESLPGTFRERRLPQMRATLASERHRKRPSS